MKDNDSEDGWRLFLELCIGKSKEELNELFQLLFTLEEKDDVAHRCLIIKELLKEEKAQRDISADLRVSIAKITRGSNALKIISRSLREYLKANLT